MDGKISLPLVDDIQAAGLTPLQLKEVLIEKLKGFVDNPTMSVTVLEANSFKVYVSGRSQTTRCCSASAVKSPWLNSSP